MATFIRLATDAAQRLLARSREVTQANRDADAERRRRATLTTRATTAATQATPAPRTGGLLEHPSRYTPRSTLPATGTLHLGWLERGAGNFGIRNDVEQSLKLISGNGAASLPIIAPAYPVPSFPTTAVPTWSSSWSGWGYIGTFGPFGPGTYWSRVRGASQIDVTIRIGWGNNTIRNRLILPHANGFIFLSYNKLDQRNGWYTYRITTTQVTAFVKGGPTDDPTTLFADPTKRYLLLESSTSSPTVISGPNTVSFTRDALEAFNVTATSVRSITAPSGLRPQFVQLFGDIGTVTTTDDFLYVPALGTVQPQYKQLTPATLDGIEYPNTYVLQIRGNGTEPGITNWWPTVTVPAYGALGSGLNLDAFKAANASTTGIAVIDTGATTASSTPIGFQEAGAPAIYRALLGTYTTPFPSPNSRPLFDVLSDLAPLPPKFAFVQARTPLGYPDYATSATYLQFPTYRAVTSNFPSDATWNSFAAPDLPSAPGPFGSYSTLLAPAASRQSVSAEGAISLFATTFGADSYCLSSLLALGFTTADLAP